MAQEKLHLKMEIDMKDNFIMDCFMEKASLFGPTGYNIKASLQIIELLDKDFINGLMEVFIRVKLKMA